MTRLEAIKELLLTAYIGGGHAVEAVFWWLVSVVLIVLVGPFLVIAKPRFFFVALENTRDERLRGEG